MTSALDKQQRVRDELLAAGVTAYGIRKSESKALYDHIGDDEHVLAAIYGQYEATSAMMIATSLRLLFIDIRAMHNIIEDTGYDSFSDIKIDEGIAFSRVTINTRPREYVFKMVNRKCARRFLNVIEEKAMIWQDVSSSRVSGRLNTPVERPTLSSTTATPDEIEFLHKNHTATISSHGENGFPHGATVFYFYDKHTPDDIYFVTKSSTATAKNIRKHNKVAFTITNSKTMTTMHIYGVTELEKESAKKNQIVSLLFRYGKQLSTAPIPPVLQIKDGSLLVYKTRMVSISIRKYM